MSKTNYLEAAYLNHDLGVSAYSQPTVYLGAFTAAPGEAGGGTEASGGSYARVALAGKFSSVSVGSSSNTAVIEFPEATASWGDITHVAVFDASTAGNMLRYAALDATRTIASGSILRFAIGGLTFTED